jgi:hypothetical protein
MIFDRSVSLGFVQVRVLRDSPFVTVAEATSAGDKLSIVIVALPESVPVLVLLY